MGVLARRLGDLAEKSHWSWIEELAVLHALQVQAQALLDMLMRFAAELGYTPTTPREAATILLREGVIDDKGYELVKKIHGFRNIVVHEYVDVDMELVNRIVKGKEYYRVLSLALTLVEKSKEKNIDP